MWVLLEIYCSLQQWNNFANWSRIDKVIAIVRLAPFFDSRRSYDFISWTYCNMQSIRFWLVWLSIITFLGLYCTVLYQMWQPANRGPVYQQLTKDGTIGLLTAALGLNRVKRWRSFTRLLRTKDFCDPRTSRILDDGHRCYSSLPLDRR